MTIKSERFNLRSLLLMLAICSCLLSVGASTATALDSHLCGMSGTYLNPQESCPGISARHSWQRVTAYRNSSSGIDMCTVIRDANNAYMFSRCYFYGGSHSIGAADLNYGRQLTRAYNKNNNVALGSERRYLYASTDR